jgi:hypothetical protein
VSITIPEGTPTLANTKIKAVLSIADQTAPKKATELDAVTSVDLSCYLFADGWTPTASTAKGQSRRRLCSPRSAERLNTTTYSIGALQYSHNPKTADTEPGNEARELLAEGTKIYLAEGQGIDGQTGEFTVGDRIRTHYVELGPQVDSGDQTDENGEFFIMQELVYVTADGPVVGTVAA